MSKYKKFRNSKAFTIVELVIVIAIVAILAAVLIPTFVNVAKEAKVTSDKTMVKNLNTALAVDEAVNGKPKTCYDALEVAKESGYSADKLTPVSSGDILWDSESNRFLLVDGDNIVFKDDSTESVDGVGVWKMIDAEELAQISAIEEESSASAASTVSTVKTKLSVAYADTSKTYSYYLKNGAGWPTSLKVNGVGIDVGENNNVNINYESSSTETVVVRTNGGSLTVNGGSVLNYGYAAKVAPKSGKYVMGENFTAEYIDFIGSTAEISISESATFKVYALPTDSTLSIDIPEGATNAYGVDIQVVNGQVQYQAFGGGTSDVLQIGTESYPYIVSSQEVFEKITDKNGYYNIDCNVEISSETTFSAESVTLDLNNNQLTCSEKLTCNDITIKNGTIVDNSSNNSQQSLYAQGDVTLVNCTCKSSDVVVAESIIMNNHSDLTIDGCTFENYEIVIKGDNTERVVTIKICDSEFKYSSVYIGCYISIDSSNVKTKFNLFIDDSDFDTMFTAIHFASADAISGSLNNVKCNGFNQSSNTSGYFMDMYNYTKRDGLSVNNNCKFSLNMETCDYYLIAETAN